MLRHQGSCVIAAAVCAVFPGGPAASAAQPTADVVHWLTAGAEAAAVTILSKAYEAQGGKWIDSAAPGGGSDAQALVMSRIAGGNPPGVAYLAMGRSAIDLGKEGVVIDAKALAEKNGLDRTSKVMLDLVTDGKGQVFALPIAVETDNLAWYSKPAFEHAGIAYPRSWNEFLADAKVFKAKGIIPIAVGAQGWQLSILLNSVLLGQGGDEFFARLVAKGASLSAPDNAEVVKAFVTLRALSTFSDAGASNRTWNDTLNLVAEGRAAMQVMGSWAGAELIKTGAKYDVSWGCALAPGSDRLVLEGAGFEFPVVKGDAERQGQALFIKVMMDASLQSEFAAVKGALPARLDADTSKLAACDQMAARTLKQAGSYPALTTTLSNEAGGQIEDLLSRFWVEATLTPEDAAKQFTALLAPG